MPGIFTGCFRSIMTATAFILFVHESALSQRMADSTLADPNLPNIIQYALRRQPAILQALADERITDYQIKSRLADWFPQVNFNYVYQHNFQVQTSVIGGNAVRLGVGNISAFQFTGNQAIFNRDLLLATRTRDDIVEQAQQQTTNTRITTVVNVSKAFYDVLATQQQIKVADENITRLQRSLKDSRAQYEAGVVDKTDYKRATIQLNNTLATKKTFEEALKGKTEYLKALINYPVNSPLQIQYDSAALEKEIFLDTLQRVDYSNRIEYKLLQTQRSLLESNLAYNRWSYLPIVSANGAYNLNYQNNSFGKLYGQSFPNSYAGITLAFPLFQGGKRIFNIRQAEWQLRKADLQIIDIKNTVNSEYSNAMAAYKASLNDYYTVRENIALAQEVYDVINLQYRSGIKAYIEVISAEADLRTAQINYFNALYNVVTAKIDVERSLGEIQY